MQRCGLNIESLSRYIDLLCEFIAVDQLRKWADETWREVKKAEDHERVRFYDGLRRTLEQEWKTLNRETGGTVVYERPDAGPDGAQYQKWETFCSGRAGKKKSEKA